MLTNISDVQTSESARYIALRVSDLMQQLCEIEHPELTEQPWILASSSHGYHAKVEVASPLARELGIEPKMKLYDLRRRMPGVRVVLPNSSLLSRWRRTLSTLCAARSLVWEVTDHGEAILQLSASEVSSPTLQKWIDSLCSDIASTMGVQRVTIVRATSRAVAEALVHNTSHVGLLDASDPQVLDTHLLTISLQTIAWLPAGVRERLQRLRIATLGDVRKYPRAFMRLHFGDMGEKLSALALGMEIDTQRANSKTLSVEKVVAITTASSVSLPQLVGTLAEQLSHALWDRNLIAKELRLSIQCADGTEYSQVVRQDAPADPFRSFQTSCLGLLKELSPIAAQPTSIRLSAVQTKSAKQQQDLFSPVSSVSSFGGPDAQPTSVSFPSTFPKKRWMDTPALAFAA